MPSKRSKQIQLTEYLETARPAAVGLAEWNQLRERLAPVSDSYLRKLLRASGVPLAPVVEGVRQDSFQQLERTLLAIGAEYAGADAACARLCRHAVIAAKDHARFVLRSPRTPAEKKAEKEEMILWMLTWLENPAVFEDWLRLRKRQSIFPQ